MHIPVLLKEVVNGLNPKDGETVIDATVGAGGHTYALGERIGKEGILIGIDEDERAIKMAEEKLRALACRVCLVRDNFRHIDSVLSSCGVRSADIILLDLGLSSMQIEESGRGFSFKSREPLLMTFRARTEEGALTAYEIVNYWSEERIARILRDYGEEKRARQITKAIIEAREKRPIGYAHELAEIVMRAAGGRAKVHPATKTFQALRIAANDELLALEEVLQKSVHILKSGGRIGVISFHSLEDRIVKQFFKLQEKNNLFSVLTKKPITPSRAELAENKRARSAKLRIARKI